MYPGLQAGRCADDQACFKLSCSFTIYRVPPRYLAPTCFSSSAFLEKLNCHCEFSDSTLPSTTGAPRVRSQLVGFDNLPLANTIYCKQAMYGTNLHVFREHKRDSLRTWPESGDRESTGSMLKTAYQGYRLFIPKDNKHDIKKRLSFGMGFVTELLMFSGGRLKAIQSFRYLEATQSRGVRFDPMQLVNSLVAVQRCEASHCRRNKTSLRLLRPGFITGLVTGWCRVYRARQH